MRHAKKRSKLGRNLGQRKALIFSLCRSLFIHQRIITTQTKAKVARPFVEKILYLAKTDNLTNRRRVFQLLNDHVLVKRVFEQLAPLFKDRNGGFTRIMRFKKRRGDDAYLSIFELVKRLPEEKPKHKEKKATASQAGTPAPEKALKKEAPAKEKIKPEDVSQKPERHPEPKPRPPKEDITKIKEDKKPGILGGVSKIFRRKQEP